MTAVWATVHGMGLWTPGFPSVAAWRQGPRAAIAAATPPARLPARLQRRASLLTRMVAEVAAQAAEQAGVPLRALPVVAGSAYGELATTMEILEELERDGTVSPFRFHNSVHNTAVGYLSIASENRAPATSLAAGDDTAAMVLQEALALLATRGGDVLALFADEALPDALTAAGHGREAFAAALLLRAPSAASGGGGRVASGALSSVGDLRQRSAGAGDHAAAAWPVDRPDPCAAILPVLAAVLDGGAPDGRVPLAPPGTPAGSARWSIAVAAGGAP